MKKKEEIMEDENIDTTKEIVTIKKEGFSYEDSIFTTGHYRRRD